MGRDALGAFEQLILLALVRLKDQAYGRTVHRELEKRLKKDIPIGQVYVALERLEQKGMVESSVGGATPTRGGRSKRYFEMTGLGQRALRDALHAVDEMRPARSELVLLLEKLA